MNKKPIILTVEGKIPSKKNAWKRGGNKVFLDEKLSAQLEVLQYQLVSQRNKLGLSIITGPVRITATFFIKGTSRSCDLDNAYTTLQDLLEKARIIKNDSQVFEITARRCSSWAEDKTSVIIYPA